VDDVADPSGGADYGPQPTLTDGVVVLRPWHDEDVERVRAGHDEEIAHWFGFDEVVPSAETQRAAVQRWREGYAADRRTVNFLIELEGDPVGNVEVRTRDDGIGELSWALYAGHRGRGYGVRAVSMLVDYAFEELGLTRVEAYVNTANERSKRLATRSGLRREGLLRGRETLRGEQHDTIVYARLHDDPPVTDPASFRALLNSFLPRKRAISQMLIRDPDGRVLMCQLTYKPDWDLPGGVVEVGESPQLAVSREVEEELGLEIKAGGLLLTDWLPPWGGWDDAVCLVFDGGVHPARILEDVVTEVREIRSARFATLEEVREHARDFTTRRIEAALTNLAGPGGSSYTESGR
jgi:RimJ/RimL family protein N-acetyltransferase/8-oxo-dGTP pyrophosphatase MutT (NUDIX family)